MKLVSALVNKIEVFPKYKLCKRQMNIKENLLDLLLNFYNLFCIININAQIIMINAEGKKLGRKKTDIAKSMPIRKIGFEVSIFFSKQRTR